MGILEYEHISRANAEELVDIWADKEVIKYTNIKKPCTLKEIEDRISKFRNHDVFIVKLNQETIGIIGCPCINKEKGEYGIFYQLKKSEWGKNIGTKVTTWLVDYMKKKYSSITLYADVVSANIASDKILKSLGFKLISEDKGGFDLDGCKIDIKNYFLS